MVGRVKTLWRNENLEGENELSASRSGLLPSPLLPKGKTLHFKAWTHYMSALASNCVICYIVVVIFLITQDRDLINYFFYSVHIPLQLLQFFIKLCLAVETCTSSWFLHIQSKAKVREISDSSNCFAYIFLTCNFSSIIFETLK